MKEENSDNTQNNREVIAAYKQLINQFQPAAKRVAEASTELVKAFQIMHKASDGYISALEELTLAGTNCQQHAKDQVNMLKQYTELMRFILKENDEFANEFGGIASKIEKYNAVEKNNLKVLGKEGLEKFYSDEFVVAVEQQNHRYKFFVEKHYYWLQHFTDMLQRTRLQWALITGVDESTGESERKMLAIGAVRNGTSEGIANGTSNDTSDIEFQNIGMHSRTSTLGTTTSTTHTLRSAITVSTLRSAATTNFTLKPKEEPPRERVEVISIKQAPRYVAPSMERPQALSIKPEIHEETPTTTIKQTVAEERKFNEGQNLSSRQTLPNGQSTNMPNKPSEVPPPVGPFPTVPGELLVCTKAFEAQANNQLTLSVGDKLQLIKTGTKGWLYVRNLDTQRTGWFPSRYVGNQT